MSDRLRPDDLSMWAGELPGSPLQNATLEIFQPGDRGFTYPDFVALVEDRIAFVPRYRQRIVTVPGGVANPMWVDDTHFDLSFHVRRSALPRPGSLEHLRDLVSRIISRPLDRSRPLWESYFIEGLADGRVAVLTKSHQILVDGVQTVDLTQVLLDVDPEPRPVVPDEWHPRREPTAAGLVLDAVADNLEHPRTLFESVQGQMGGLLRKVSGPTRLVGDVLGALDPRGGRHRSSPLRGTLSEQRTFVAVQTSLADHRLIRQTHGGTVNDVVLATVTGALRNWLMTRGESVGGQRQVKALVPMSVIDDEMEPTSLGSQVSGYPVELPVGESSPLVRLHQVSWSFKAHRATGKAVAADKLTGVAGFAPTTFHALGGRVAARELGRGDYDLSVTNVPGPQFPLYAAGAKMEASYPVPTLISGHALAVGVTSYNGLVCYGITADRDVMPDAGLLHQCFQESLEELVESAVTVGRRAPRGRSSQGSTPGKSAGAAEGEKKQ